MRVWIPYSMRVWNFGSCEFHWQISCEYEISYSCEYVTSCEYGSRVCEYGKCYASMYKTFHASMVISRVLRVWFQNPCEYGKKFCPCEFHWENIMRVWTLLFHASMFLSHASFTMRVWISACEYWSCEYGSVVASMGHASFFSHATMLAACEFLLQIWIMRVCITFEARLP